MSANIRGIWLLTCLLLALLAGCKPTAPPEDVASAFWQAAIAGDRERLAGEVRRTDRDSVTRGDALLPVRRYELGRRVIEADRARIDTQIELGGDTPMNLAIETVLVEEEGRWRVDYAATVHNITGDSSLAHLLDELRGLGREFGDGLDRSLGELERALPRLEAELHELERDIRGQLPALRERLEDLTRALPRPLQPSPPPATRPLPPDTVKAI